jgi:hypothetical protein
MPSLSKRSVILCCLLSIGMGYYYFVLFLPYAHDKLESVDLNRGYRYGCDLYPLWLTSRQIVQSRQGPYTPETTKQIQVGLYGRTLNRPGDPPANYRAFAYPLYADLFVLPIAWLPFPIVQAICALLFPLIVILSCSLWLRFLDVRLPPPTSLSFLLLLLLSYPVIEGLYALQPSLIVALLLAGTAVALARNRMVLAGALLALASVKPQLIVILALWLLLWAATDIAHRKALVFSFCATLVVLFYASQLAVPGWTTSWIHSLTDYRRSTDPPLVPFAFGAIAGNLVSLGLLAAAAILAFRARQAEAKSSQFVTTFCFLLVVTVLIGPSSIAVYDHILLVPAILWLLSRKTKILQSRTPIRIVAFIAIAAVAWQWLAASGVAVASLVFPVVLRTAWVRLPLRMAASVPFAVVALWLFLIWKGNLSDPTAAKSPALSG